MNGAREPVPRESVAEIAARWFARRRAGDMSEAEARAFAVWLGDSNDHARAFRQLETAWRDVESMRDDPRIMAMRAEAAEPRRRLIGAGAIAASLALAAAGGAAYYLIGGQGLDQPATYQNREYRTALGERATFTLPDGSIVTLNTDSVVRTQAAWNKRVVYLDRGQAFFRVAKDHERPFIVAAAGRTVTARGTAFDVRVEGRRSFAVTLVEGAVRVESQIPASGGREAVEMSAGTKLLATGDARWTVRPVDVGEETSWLSGQLVFSDVPLETVVAELNRYSEKKIIIGDMEFAKTPISGTFKAGDVDAFAHGLESYKVARVDYDSEDVIRVVRPSRGKN